MLSKKRSLIILIVVEFIVLGLLVSSLLYALNANNSANQQLNKLIQQRHVSVRLADELRRSSDDMTRMVRLYAVTGDERYRDFFYDILAIRHGEEARPQGYGQVFWDLKLANDGFGQQLGEKVSMQVLMVRAGVTEAEFALLAEAERRSDQLAEKEELAINARESSPVGAGNKFTLMDKQGSTLPMLLLFGPEYHQAKAEIMAPINDFLASVEARTKGAVQEMQVKIQELLNLLIAQAVFLTLFVALMFLTMLRYQKVSSAILRKSEDRYKTLVENTEDLITRVDNEGRLLYVNASALKYWGVPPEECLGRLAFDFICPEDRERTLTQFNAWLNSQAESVILENRNVHVSGKTTKMQWVVATVRDKAGQIIEFNSIGRDVTAKREIEEELRRQIDDYALSQQQLQESEDRYRALHNASFGGVIIHDKSLILDCNQALSEITGYSHEELIGMNGLKLIADDSLDLVLHNIQGGFEERYEVEGLRKDGSVYPLSIKGKNIQYQGRKARVIEFLDITERKQAENDLRKNEMKQLAMIENIVDVIAIVGRDGINQYKSPNIEKIFGWRPEDVVGVTTWENVHPDDLHATQEVFAAILEKDNASTKGECRYRCKDGSFKWIEYNAVNCLHDPNISGVLLSYHDISERKKIAEQRIRSGQLSALGELATGVAHEINNPITGVINYAQLLLNKHAEDEREKRLLNSIVKEGNRIATIVRNLLNFAHKDRDSMMIITIYEVVHESVALLQQQLLGDGIFLEIELAEDLPNLYGNAQKLEQVVLNLVSNSRHALNAKFSASEKDKVLRISAEKVMSGNNARIRLTLYDQGCGISDRNMQRVFNRFFTTKPAGVGTGLGLSIVHDILDEHGATIEFESKVDRFTRVVIEFPAHEEGMANYELPGS